MTASAIVSSLLRPSELYSLIKFRLSTPPSPASLLPHHATPEDFKSNTRAACYHFLNLTSRSFARVIQELDQELRDVVCIYYLVLRGLDTIEDDMTLPFQRKKHLLETFAHIIQDKKNTNWSFHENGESEKDRNLLIHFYVVIQEFHKLRPDYQQIILKTTQDMGNGMSSFVPTPSSTTLSTYNLYTHYVAGLVGIGLSQLFSASGLESPKLALQTDLANTMGCFLQKVNILKDFGVDCNEGRVWWPKEVWSKWIPNTSSTSLNNSLSYTNNDLNTTVHSTRNGSDVEMIGSVQQLMEPHNRERAIGCLNELCADGLSGWTGCLEWMSQVNNASVFRFAAVPQLMAIKSLSLFYANPELFSKSLKIRRGEAVQLIEAASEGMTGIKRVSRQCVRDIAKKNALWCQKYSQNKSFSSCINETELKKRCGSVYMSISETCGKIEAWCNEHDKKFPETLSKRLPGDRTWDIIMIFTFFLILYYQPFY